ncbi:MAG: Shedu immune nuclease family protein [Oscillospiraceae bacterium]|nr:Shedu immune nuclease family protein [Oscillospiraceae bacterium]
MEIITTQSKGNDFVEVDQEFLLDETPKTKTVFKAAMHPGGIRGDIIRYRKDANGNGEDLVPVNFNSLHEGEGIKITLPTEAISILYQKLEELRLVLEEQGVHYGEHNYTISDANALVINDQNKAGIIRKLLEADYGEEVWDQLVQDNPDIATRLANSRLQEDRTTVLHSFEQMLSDNALSENAWQNFFENNTWIFGYGLRYQILRNVRNQPNYGGADITGAGGQRGDFLTATEAETKFTCLVEIKKPTSPLIQGTAYRNGVWGASSELSGAISQVQVNCAQWEISGARTEQNHERLAEVNTISPKGIVIIGKTGELDNWNKRNSFERFRREIHNPEIITYDELYERARFIVEGQAPQISDEADDDLPF